MKKYLLLLTPEDTPYLNMFKALLSTSFAHVKFSVSTNIPDNTITLKGLATTHGFDGVFTTSPKLLKKLVGAAISSSEESIANYAGSYFTVRSLPVVILNPLAHLVTVPYGAFLIKRYISKLTNPEKWMPCATFRWNLITPANYNEITARLSEAILLAVDIETTNNPVRRITYIGFTGVYKDGTCSSHVMEIADMFSVVAMRVLCSLPPPKVFQNGKYDTSWLLAWGCPVYNYVFDTANLFHSHYSELPKTLGFLQAFFVRDAAYWKDLAKSGDKETYCLYNAKDTWATAMACIAMLNEMPRWAKDNYLNEFPLTFPCLLSEMTGIRRDMQRLEAESKKQDDVITKEEASMEAMLGAPFNTGSPKQKKALLGILGCADLADKSTDSKTLDKVAYRHPLNAIIVGKIKAIQKAKKLKSTYLTPGKEYNGVVLSALNPHGTDTSRLASREHHFWCGINIQNVPRGRSAPKLTFVPYDGFMLAECDLEQAESRDTAYAAGEPKLIEAVSGERDFHSLNAASFFGVSYEDIYDVVAAKVKDKDRRELGKKVNHGANYLMGAGVLVDTMGEANIFKAAFLLGLPKHWTAKQIAETLLEQFHKTYPGLSTVYYPAIVKEVVQTRLLKSRATHLLKGNFDVPEWNLIEQEKIGGLTRYCFYDPVKDKRAKNAYVAHVSQSLNAMTLNKAFMLVFYKIATHPIHRANFILNAQIHDSILFQFRIGHEYLCDMVKECMEVPVRITSYDGKVREFTVPAAVKAGLDNKGALTWGDI